MRVISLQSLKGGVGKTTLSVCLAYEAASRGFQVMLVDTDPSRGARLWLGRRQEACPFALAGLGDIEQGKVRIHRDLPQLARGRNLIILDGPPQAGPIARSGMLAADVVLIPCTPSPMDVHLARTTLDMAREVEDYRPIQTRVVLTQYDSRTRVAGETRQELERLGWPLLQAQTHLRTAYRKAAWQGLSVHELAEAHDATAEIAAIWREIADLPG